MIETWLEDQNFQDKNFSGHQLTQTEYDNCVFQNCDFSNADFTESDFVKCRFEQCNFSLAKLTGTGMKDVQFLDCKMVGLNFENCSDFLFSLNFRKCKLDYSVFAGKRMKKTIFDTCSLLEVDFTETDLSMAEFRNTDLSNAVFLGSNLEKSDFRTAQNYSLDPEKNKIRKAKFSFSGVAGLLEKYNIDIE